jgi:hypothetical protein
VTHTEKVHVYFGIGVMLMGVLALYAVRRPDGWPRTAWPMVCLILGLLLFVPVEAQTRTYQPVGWWDTFFSWIPAHPETWLEDWLSKAGQFHVIQHKVGGFLAFAIGAIELGVARRWLAHDGWTRLLPWFSIAIGLSFAIHGGTERHLPSAPEQFQHWIMGAGFAVGGIVLALHQSGILRSAGWKYAWPLFVTATGLEISLFYRLASGAAGHGGLP